MSIRLDINLIIFRLNILFSFFYYSGIKNLILVSRCMYVNFKNICDKYIFDREFRFE